MNRFDVSGKVTMIVGGRGYLGSHVANAMAEGGAVVYCADMGELSAARQKSSEDQVHASIHQMVMDATDPASVNACVDQIVQKHGRIDVLVFAVTFKPKGFYLPYTEYPLETWRKVLQVELDGAFLTSQAVGRVMEKQKEGSIIFFSSMYGLVGNDQRIYEGSNLAQLYGDAKDNAPKQIYAPAAYNVAKGGVIMLARYLAAYWGSKRMNIRANCVCPGGVYHKGEDEGFLAKYSAKTPLGRKADPEEIANATLFLASRAATYITGHNLVVDGGWTAW